MCSSKKTHIHRTQREDSKRQVDIMQMIPQKVSLPTPHLYQFYVEIISAAEYQ